MMFALTGGGLCQKRVQDGEKGCGGQKIGRVVDLLAGTGRTAHAAEATEGRRRNGHGHVDGRRNPSAPIPTLFCQGCVMCAKFIHMPACNVWVVSLPQTACASILRQENVLMLSITHLCIFTLHTFVDGKSATEPNHVLNFLKEPPA